MFIFKIWTVSCKYNYVSQEHNLEYQKKVADSYFQRLKQN